MTGPPPDTRGDRDRLTAQLAAVDDQIRALHRQHGDIVAASRDSNADDEHDPEGSTIAFERAQVGAVILSADRRLVDIAAALARLDAGAYGGCECCGRPIPGERLAIRPTARACVSCG